MNKNIVVIISLVLMFLVGTVLAELGLNLINGTSSMTKIQRDTLLNTLPTGTAKEIKPSIIIECSDTECKWSAYQNGLIDSKDNVISKYNSRGILKTNAEIEKEVTEAVKNKLTGYADELNKGSYEVVGTGTITFTEQR